MNLPLRIARRYLFAKKSTNAINMITGIAVLGLALGAAALILVLSAFNGLEELLFESYGAYNPDVLVSPEKGKSFPVDSATLTELRALEGIAAVSETLEEVAFFEHKDKQDFGIIKGVDEYFKRVTGIDSALREGRYDLFVNDRPAAIMGVGMRSKLAVSVADPFASLTVYMAKDHPTGPFEKPFRERRIQPVGTLVLELDFNNEYVLAPLSFTRELLARQNEVTALEIDLEKGVELRNVKKEILEIMGPGFRLQDRYEQEESFIWLVKIERFLAYLIACLMVVLIAFNLIGALWMVVLEKKQDIAILRSMGCSEQNVRNIFLYEGGLLSLGGILLGFSLALILVFLQKQFDLITMPGSYLVEAYPVSLQWQDFILVALTVLFIGLLASLPPAIRAQRIGANIREE